MTQKDVRTLITKYGKFIRKEGTKNVCEMKCQGCGGVITNKDEGELDAVFTKRGTAFVWHRSCWPKVWNSRIK